MLRLAISVEGATEREFVSRVLAPYFTGKNIFITSRVLGNDRKGGNISIDRAYPIIQKLLYEFDFVTTLYDFYGFQKNAGKTVDELQNLLMSKITQEKTRNFIPYIQKYEFEALLFSQPSAIANRFNQPEKLAILESIVKKAVEPEEINGGYDTCPSRRLEKLFQGFNKKFHAPVICEQIGIEAIRNACPRFHNWVLQLENLPSKVRH